jgi:hypothetical protein
VYRGCVCVYNALYCTDYMVKGVVHSVRLCTALRYTR